VIIILIVATSSFAGTCADLREDGFVESGKSFVVGERSLAPHENKRMRMSPYPRRAFRD
jgi:hypothetical protein